MNGRGGGSRTRTLPFMRRLLFHLSYSAILILEARGGVEPRAFPPSSCRFGLEDRRRERGPKLEAMVRFELTQCCLRDSRSASWSYIAEQLAGA